MPDEETVVAECSLDRDSTRRSEPDTAALGPLSLGAAGVNALLAFSYFYSPLTYLFGPVAIVLGLLARGDQRSRSKGTAAVVIAVAAVLWSTWVLFVSPGS